MKAQALVADSRSVRAQTEDLRQQIEATKKTYEHIPWPVSAFEDETLRLNTSNAQERPHHETLNAQRDVEHGIARATIYDAPIPSRHSTPDEETPNPGSIR